MKNESKINEPKNKSGVSAFLRTPFKWAGRKTAAPLFILYACVTAYMCLFFAMPQAGAVVINHNAPAVHATSGSATTGPEVVVPPCQIVPILIIISGSGIIMLMLFYIVCYSAPVGPTPIQGPLPPIGSPYIPGSFAVRAADSSTLPPNVNPNCGEPYTIFYLQNDLVVSNSAGLPNNNALPPLISLEGNSIPYGSELNLPAPGLTTPPSVCIWSESNPYSDPILDPSHPYVAVENFTLLAKSNLAAAWQEQYTVVEWVNNNVQQPLATTVYYTNGVAMATNWTQLFGGTQPTNMIVYGNLPQFTLPAFITNSVSGGGTNVGIGPFPGNGGTNNVPSMERSQFFQLTANTNGVSTGWPYITKTASLK